MTDNLWTKGPWRAEGPDMFGDYNIVLADNSDDCLAIAAVVSNLRIEEMVEANAHLIASAPELYEALAAIVSDIMLGDDVGAFLIAKHAGQAALALARGEPA